MVSWFLRLCSGFGRALQRGELISEAAGGGRDILQGGHALGGGGRRGAPASGPGFSRPLPVLLRAGGDRAGPCSRGVDAGGRPVAGTFAGDGLA